MVLPWAITLAFITLQSLSSLLLRPTTLLFTFPFLALTCLCKTPLWLHQRAELLRIRTGIDSLSWAMLTLTFLVLYLCILASWDSKLSTQTISIFSRVTLLGFILILTFTALPVIYFYVLFEASLLPIFLIVLYGGYQPERFAAGVALLFYTLLASLPLLFILRQLSLYISLSFLRVSCYSLFSPISSFHNLILRVALFTGFLVKLPLFGCHQWLPKAHVEAPVAGSIILAAILLKLGGFGLFRFSRFLDSSSFWISLILAVALPGASLIALLCLRQLDLKILIAYSSVRHIGFVVAGYLLDSSWGVIAATLMIIAHGICSSGIFAGANLIYVRSHSRLMVLNKGILSILPLFSLFWFILALGNMGAPPTINLIREILALICLINTSIYSLPALAALTFLAAAYTLILYSVTQHGYPAVALRKPSTLNQIETTLLFQHCVWLFTLPLAVGLVFYTNITLLSRSKSYLSLFSGTSSLLILHKNL